MPCQVSIIIPCWNREQFIAESIETALAQGADCEVIVIDDGSTDGSWDIIRSYPSVRSVKTDNRGVSAARNTALRICEGQFVRFHDSDDLIPAGAIRQLLAASGSSDSQQIFFGDAESIDEDGDPTNGPGYGYSDQPPGPLPVLDLASRVMNSVLPLFPAQALREVGGFNERLRVSEDYELAARLVAKGYAFVRVPTVVCQVREHSGPRASREYGAAGFRNQLVALASAVESAGEYAPQLSLGAAQIAWSLGRSASRQRLKSEAECLFDFARKAAGRHAYRGHAGLHAAYRFMPPYAAERALEAAKSILR